MLGVVPYSPVMHSQRTTVENVKVNGAKPTKPKRYEISQQALGDAFALERIRAGFTQIELSESSGMARSFISELELGLCDASLVSLYRLGMVLGVDVSTIMKMVETVPGNRLKELRKVAVLPREMSNESLIANSKSPQRGT